MPGYLSLYSVLAKGFLLLMPDTPSPSTLKKLSVTRGRVTSTSLLPMSLNPLIRWIATLFVALRAVPGYLLGFVGFTSLSIGKFVAASRLLLGLELPEPGVRGTSPRASVLLGAATWRQGSPHSCMLITSNAVLTTRMSVSCLSSVHNRLRKSRGAGRIAYSAHQRLPASM